MDTSQTSASTNLMKTPSDGYNDLKQSPRTQKELFLVSLEYLRQNVAIQGIAVIQNSFLLFWAFFCGKKKKKEERIAQYFTSSLKPLLVFEWKTIEEQLYCLHWAWLGWCRTCIWGNHNVRCTRVTKSCDYQTSDKYKLLMFHGKFVLK